MRQRRSEQPHIRWLLFAIVLNLRRVEMGHDMDREHRGVRAMAVHVHFSRRLVLDDLAIGSHEQERH